MILHGINFEIVGDSVVEVVADLKETAALGNDVNIVVGNNARKECYVANIIYSGNHARSGANIFHVGAGTISVSTEPLTGMEFQAVFFDSSYRRKIYETGKA